MPKLLLAPDTMFQLKSFSQPQVRGKTKIEPPAHLTHEFTLAVIPDFSPDKSYSGWAGSSRKKSWFCPPPKIPPPPSTNLRGQSARAIDWEPQGERAEDAANRVSLYHPQSEESGQKPLSPKPRSAVFLPLDNKALESESKVTVHEVLGVDSASRQA